jgi:hypothetical protein
MTVVKGDKKGGGRAVQSGRNRREQCEKGRNSKISDFPCYNVKQLSGRNDAFSNSMIEMTKNCCRRRMM